MKNFKLLFITLSSVLLSYCSDNIDEEFTKEADIICRNYIIDEENLITIMWRTEISSNIKAIGFSGIGDGVTQDG